MAIKGLPDNSVKSIETGNVTQADLEEYRGDNRDRMQMPDMSGREFEYMDSARYDADTRGLSQPDILETSEPEPDLTRSQNQEAYVEPVQPEPETDYRRKYGESENEKGEWRRVASEAQEQNRLLAQQLAEITNRLTQPVMQQQPSGPPPRLFPEKQPGELVTFQEIEQILLNEVLPTIEQRSQLAASQAQDLAAASAQKMLPNWDVSPSEENSAINSLRNEFVNFDNRFTATEKNRMVLGKVNSLRSSNGNNLNRPPVAQAVGRVSNPPVLVDPNRTMRRATYIESANPVQPEPHIPTSRPAQFQAALDALDAEARAKTGGRASAKQMEALFEKFGYGRVNDWGNGTSSR